jgi:multidrug transporter EmrE-like cation transporter
MKWLILVCGIIANASASVLIKVALRSVRKPHGLADCFGILVNLPLVFGVFLYGLAFVLYAISLTRFPLNVAHPILTSGAIGLVAVYSFFVLREQFYWTTLLGLCLIATGVFLLTWRVG